FHVTGVQTCALPIFVLLSNSARSRLAGGLRAHVHDVADMAPLVNGSVERGRLESFNKAANASFGCHNHPERASLYHDAIANWRHRNKGTLGPARYPGLTSAHLPAALGRPHPGTAPGAAGKCVSGKWVELSASQSGP